MEVGGPPPQHACIYIYIHIYVCIYMYIWPGAHPGCIYTYGRGRTLSCMYIRGRGTTPPACIVYVCVLCIAIAIAIAAIGACVLVLVYVYMRAGGHTPGVYVYMTGGPHPRAHIKIYGRGLTPVYMYIYIYMCVRAAGGSLPGVFIYIYARSPGEIYVLRPVVSWSNHRSLIYAGSVMEQSSITHVCR